MFFSSHVLVCWIVAALGQLIGIQIIIQSQPVACLDPSPADQLQKPLLSLRIDCLIPLNTSMDSSRLLARASGGGAAFDGMSVHLVWICPLFLAMIALKAYVKSGPKSSVNLSNSTKIEPTGERPAASPRSPGWRAAPLPGSLLLLADEKREVSAIKYDLAEGFGQGEEEDRDLELYKSLGKGKWNVKSKLYTGNS